MRERWRPTQEPPGVSIGSRAAAVVGPRAQALGPVDASQRHLGGSHEASHWHRRHLLQGQRRSGHYRLGTSGTWESMSKTGAARPSPGPTPRVSRLQEQPIWSIGPAEGDHFAPSTASFMVNYRVEDLHALVKVLRRRRLQRAREDRRFRVREVCLGHRSRRKQGRTLATACRPMTRAVGFDRADPLRPAVRTSRCGWSGVADRSHADVVDQPVRRLW